MVQEYADYLDKLRFKVAGAAAIAMNQAADMAREERISRPTEALFSKARDTPVSIGKIEKSSQITVKDIGWSEEQKNRMRQFGYDDMDIVREWYN